MEQAKDQQKVKGMWAILLSFSFCNLLPETTFPISFWASNGESIQTELTTQMQIPFSSGPSQQSHKKPSISSFMIALAGKLLFAYDPMVLLAPS